MCTRVGALIHVFEEDRSNCPMCVITPMLLQDISYIPSIMTSCGIIINTPTPRPSEIRNCSRHTSIKEGFPNITEKKRQEELLGKEAGETIEE